ncbi:titin homolog isoform X2 [Branchiostoma lanceolatum]|uniref:titin homolog isoform X2 n=1 Tax=Branchiostoma lanceolatum TaxID=7740 RepID=UPI003454AB47
MADKPAPAEASPPTVQEAEPSQTPAPVSDGPGETKEEREPIPLPPLPPPAAEVAQEAAEPTAVEQSPVVAQEAVETPTVVAEPPIEPPPAAAVEEAAPEASAAEPTAAEQSPVVEEAADSESAPPPQEVTQVAEVVPQTAEVAPTEAPTAQATVAEESPAPVVEEAAAVTDVAPSSPETALEAVEAPTAQASVAEESPAPVIEEAAAIAEVAPQEATPTAGETPAPAVEEAPPSVLEAPKEPAKPEESSAKIKMEVTASEVEPATPDVAQEAVVPVVSWSVADAYVDASEVTADVSVPKTEVTPAPPPSPTPAEAPQAAKPKEKPKAEVTPPPVPIEKPNAKVAPPTSAVEKPKVTPPPTEKPKAKVTPPPTEKPKAKVAPPPATIEKPKAKAAPPPPAKKKKKGKAPPAKPVPVEVKEETKTVTFAPGEPEAPVESKVTVVRTVTPSAQPEVMRKIQKLQAKAQPQTPPPEVRGVRKVTRIVTEEKQPEVTEVRKVTKTTVEQPEVTEMRKVTRTVIEQPPEVTEVRRVTRTVTEQPEVSEVRRVTRTVTSQPEVSEVRRVTRTVTEQPEVSEVRRVTRTVTSQPEVSEVRTFTRTVSEQQPQVTQVRKVTRTLSSDQKPDVKTTTFRTVTSKAEPPEVRKTTKVTTTVMKGEPVTTTQTKVEKTAVRPETKVHTITKVEPPKIVRKVEVREAPPTVTKTVVHKVETAPEVKKTVIEAPPMKVYKKFTRVEQPSGPSRVTVRRTEFEAGPGDIETRKLKHRIITTTTTTTTEDGETTEDVETRTEESSEVDEGKRVGKLTRYRIEGEHPVRRGEELQRDEATLREVRLQRLRARFEAGEQLTDEEKISMQRMIEEERSSMPGPGVSWELRHKFEKGDVRNAELNIQREVATEVVRDSYGQLIPKFDRGEVHTAEPTYQGEKPEDVPTGVSTVFKRKFERGDVRNAELLDFSEEAVVAMGAAKGLKNPFEVNADMVHNAEFNIQKEQCPLYDRYVPEKKKFEKGDVSNLEFDRQPKFELAKEIKYIKFERKKAEPVEQEVGTVFTKDVPPPEVAVVKETMKKKFVTGDVHNAEFEELQKQYREETVGELQEVQQERKQAEKVEQVVGTIFFKDQPYEVCKDLLGSMRLRFLQGDVHNAEFDERSRVEALQEISLVRSERSKAEQVEQLVGTVFFKDQPYEVCKNVAGKLRLRFREGEVSNAEFDDRSKLEVLEELQQVRQDLLKAEKVDQVVGTIFYKDQPYQVCQDVAGQMRLMFRGEVHNVEEDDRTILERTEELEQVKEAVQSAERVDQVVGTLVFKDRPYEICKDLAGGMKLRFSEGNVSNAEFDYRTVIETQEEIERMRVERLAQEQVDQSDVGTRYDRDIPPPTVGAVKASMAEKFKRGDVHNAEFDLAEKERTVGELKFVQEERAKAEQVEQVVGTIYYKEEPYEVCQDVNTGTMRLRFLQGKAWNAELREVGKLELAEEIELVKSLRRPPGKLFIEQAVGTVYFKDHPYDICKDTAGNLRLRFQTGDVHNAELDLQSRIESIEEIEQVKRERAGAQPVEQVVGTIYIKEIPYNVCKDVTGSMRLKFREGDVHNVEVDERTQLERMEELSTVKEARTQTVTEEQIVGTIYYKDRPYEICQDAAGQMRLRFQKGDVHNAEFDVRSKLETVEEIERVKEAVQSAERVEQVVGTIYFKDQPYEVCRDTAGSMRIRFLKGDVHNAEFDEEYRQQLIRELAEVKESIASAEKVDQIVGTVYFKDKPYEVCRDVSGSMKLRFTEGDVSNAEFDMRSKEQVEEEISMVREAVSSAERVEQVVGTIYYKDQPYDVCRDLAGAMRMRFRTEDVHNAEFDTREREEIEYEIQRVKEERAQAEFEDQIVGTIYYKDQPYEVCRDTVGRLQIRWGQGDVQNAELTDVGKLKLAEEIEEVHKERAHAGRIKQDVGAIYDKEAPGPEVGKLKWQMQQKFKEGDVFNAELDRTDWLQAQQEIERVRYERKDFQPEDQVVGAIYFKDQPYDVCKDVTGALRLMFRTGEVIHADFDESFRLQALEEIEEVRRERAQAQFEEQIVGTVYYKDQPYDICQDLAGKLRLRFLKGDVHNAELTDVGKLELQREIEEVERERVGAQPIDQRVGTNYTPEKPSRDVGKVKWAMQNKFKKGDVSNIEIDREYYQQKEQELEEVKVGRLQFEPVEQVVGTLYYKEIPFEVCKDVGGQLRMRFRKGNVSNIEIDEESRMMTLKELELVQEERKKAVFEQQTVGTVYWKDKPYEICRDTAGKLLMRFLEGDVHNAELADVGKLQLREEIEEVQKERANVQPLNQQVGTNYTPEKPTKDVGKVKWSMQDKFRKGDVSNIEINREYYEEKAKEIEDVKVGRLNFEAEEQIVGTVYYKDRPYEVCRDLAGQLRMRFAQGNVSNIEIDEETRRRAIEELELVREEREKAVFEEQTVGTVYWKDQPYEVCRDTTGKLLMHFLEGDVHNAELRDVGKLEIKQEIQEVQKERANAQPLDQQVGTNYTPEKAPTDIGKIKWSMQNKFKKGGVTNIEIDREYYVEKEKELEEVKVGRLNFEQVDQQVGTVYEKDVVPGSVKKVKKEASRKFKTGDVSNAELDVSSRMEALQELESVRTERSQMEFEQQVVGTVYEKDVPPPECKVRKFVAEKFKKGDVSNIEINREIFEQKQKELEEVRVGRLSIEAEDQIVGARYDKEVIPARIDTAKEARMKFLQGQVSNAELDDRTRQEALAELESVRSARLQMEEVRQEVGTRYDKDIPPPECCQVKKIGAAKFKEGDVHNAELDFRSRLEAEKEIERVLVERQQYEDEVLPVGTVVERERADLVCKDASRQVKGRFVNGAVEDEHEHDPGLKEREEITEEILMIRQRQLEEEEQLIRERFERGEIISEEVIQRLRESRRRIQEEIEEYVLTTPTEIRVVYESEPTDSDLPHEGDMEDVPVVLGKSRNLKQRFESLGDEEELVIMHVPKDRVWKAATVLPGKEYCFVCGKRVWPMEKLSADDVTYHRGCFRCQKCSCVLSLREYVAYNGNLYCRPHFFEITGHRRGLFYFFTDKLTEGKAPEPKPVIEKPVTPPPEPKKVVFTPAPALPPPKKHKVKFEEPTLVPAAEPRKVTVGPVGGTKTVTKAVVAEPVRGPKTVVTGPVVESREVSTAGREVSTAGREVSTAGRVVSTAGRELSTKREESRDVSIKRDETRKVFVGPAQVTTKVETVRGDPNVQRHVETGPVEEVREVITDPDGTKRTIIRRRVVKTTKTTTSTPVITKRVETKTQAVRSGVTRTAESKMTMSSKKVTSSSGESVAKATKTITRQVTPGDVRVETQIKQARSQDKTSVTKRTT